MDDLRDEVRKRYGAIAAGGGCCCSPAGTASDATGSGGCCGGSAERIGVINGYTAADLTSVPDGANLGLGCGNPTAIGSLQSGETVLDLGSGAGFDCFLAAGKVGPDGRVIGLDMTPEMLERARANAVRGGFGNVEFIGGFMESIPLADSSVDVVISNCVINLSVDKPQVFREVYRVLKPGGRMYVSDVALTRRLPAVIRNSSGFYTACIAGAMLKKDYLKAIEAAGLEGIRIISERPYPLDISAADPFTARLVRLAMKLPHMRRRMESAVSLSVAAARPE